MASLFFLLSLQPPLERCHAMSRTKDEHLEGKTRDREIGIHKVQPLNY